LQTTFDRTNPEDVRNIPDTLVVTLSDNDVRDNGFIGIRLYAKIGRGYQTTDGTQPLTAVLTANVLETRAPATEPMASPWRPGSPGKRSAPVRPHLRRQLRRELIRRQRPRGALLDFTRWEASLGLVGPIYKFAEESTYNLTDVNGELAGFDYDHPVTDPVSGTVLNNTLTLNGVEVPHGTRITPQAARR
jgi:hypothetical protein